MKIKKLTLIYYSNLIYRLCSNVACCPTNVPYRIFRERACRVTLAEQLGAKPRPSRQLRGREFSRRRPGWWIPVAATGSLFVTKQEKPRTSQRSIPITVGLVNSCQQLPTSSPFAGPETEIPMRLSHCKSKFFCCCCCYLCPKAFLTNTIL